MIPNLAQQACSAAERQRAAELHESTDPRTGPLQHDILAILHSHPAGLNAADLAEMLCVIRQNIDCSLRGLLRRGEIERIEGERPATHRNQMKKVWIYRIKPA